MAEQPNKYYKSEYDVKKAIEKSNLVQISEEAIEDVDIKFFDEGEMKYDSVNGQLVLRHQNSLIRFQAI